MAKNGKNSGHAGTLAEWKARRRLDVTLPSGMPITMRTLTLSELAVADGLPDDLIRLALVEMQPGGIVGEIGAELQKSDEGALERAKKYAEDNLALRDRLILAAVLDPVMNEDDVRELDGFDKEMIAGIASRQLEFDAIGRRVGSEPLSTFRVFAATHHEQLSAEDCPACEEARRQFSAVHA